ncbi:MAG: dihydroorotase family protein [Calditrichae bacterium]|nr:dihydroorotase family protein [Calditrichia bacterium]
MGNILLKNGRLPDGQTCNIMIEDERIAYIGSSFIKNCLEIDCTGYHFLPGIIDVHTHIRDMDLSYKEDWFSASQAAVAGGVTTVCDMPNTRPATFDEASLKVKKDAAKKSIANYSYNFGVTESNEKEIKSAASINALKMFMAESSSGYVVEQPEVVKKVLQIAKEINKPVIVHSELQTCVEAFEKKYQATIGNHNKIRNPQCAIKATELLIKLAAQTGAKVYLAHISTEQEIEMIRQAKNAGLDNLFCEITPHHLFINEDVLKVAGNFGKVNPPLRSKSDNNALEWAIINGIADTIGTDHAPHSLEEKQKEYVKAPSGFPGLETSFALMLQLVHSGKITLTKLTEIMSENPAHIFNFKDRGMLQIGKYADIAIVDLNEEWRVDPKEFRTKAKYSPFSGMNLKGKVKMTLVNGNLVYNHGKITDIKGKEVEFN